MQGDGMVDHPFHGFTSLKKKLEDIILTHAVKHLIDDRLASVLGMWFETLRLGDRYWLVLGYRTD